MMRLGLILSALLVAGAAQAEPVRATVETGVLVGEATERANVFKNVPYAAPPIGALRWAPPARAQAWSGERDASKAGVSCPQPMNADGTPNFGSANGPVSEDCLQLNVFAPKAAKKAPVMVWLHGGSHRFGAGWIYDGQAFARDGVVMVSLNYRLGALGYFAHPALTAAEPSDPLGSYGLMDQIAALQWVQRNIAVFGGDPANVTVFGESAGGASVLALLATSSAKGLFHKAVVQSGGGWGRGVDLVEKEAQGARLAERLGLPGRGATLEQLRAVPVDRLVAEASDGFGPFVDGRLMKATPAQAFASGQATDVPLIIGSNSGEDSLMREVGLTPAQAARDVSDAVKPAYAAEAAQGEEVLARAVFTDRQFAAPARWIAAKASKGKPAWLYHFSYVGTRFRPALTRAAHAAEIQYVLEYWGRRTPISMVAEEDKAMAAKMHGCWVAFAKMPVDKSGALRCQVAWPAYVPAKDQLVEFGSSSGVRTGFRKAQLDAQQADALPTLDLPTN